MEVNKVKSELISRHEQWVQGFLSKKIDIMGITMLPLDATGNNFRVDLEVNNVLFPVFDKIKSEKPVMLEIGCYWAFWSLLFKKRFENSESILVEAQPRNLAVGIKNFELNNYIPNYYLLSIGHFLPDLNDRIALEEGIEEIGLKDFLEKNEYNHIDILHSDIQGSESYIIDDLIHLIESSIIDNSIIALHSPIIEESIIDKVNKSSLDFTLYPISLLQGESQIYIYRKN